MEHKSLVFNLRHIIDYIESEKLPSDERIIAALKHVASNLENARQSKSVEKSS